MIMVSLVIIIVFKRLFLFVLQSCCIFCFFFLSLSFSLSVHLLTTRGLLNNTVRKRYWFIVYKHWSFSLVVFILFFLVFFLLNKERIGMWKIVKKLKKNRFSFAVCFVLFYFESHWFCFFGSEIRAEFYKKKKRNRKPWRIVKVLHNISWGFDLINA